MPHTNLTHLNRDGEARMVDVGSKEVTERIAVAEGRITMSLETLELIRTAGSRKGDVLAVARVAGIMAAKMT
ncbi:MAG: cyclic pyranopterin monophosphate synthase MoaC, partial [Gammaproteobacteria bacterium]|nr:cyclic pyranopterin monophosphate synthase MoaC [Gammaproteobacteria bacterium]